MDWIGSDIARDRVINVSFEVNTRGIEIWIERARKQIEHRRNTDEMKNEKKREWEIGREISRIEHRG